MGNFTCMGYPGTTLDKIIQDAQTFAKWKVDMLKLDGCFSTPEERAKGESQAGWGPSGRQGWPRKVPQSEPVCLSVWLLGSSVFQFLSPRGWRILAPRLPKDGLVPGPT